MIVIRSKFYSITKRVMTNIIAKLDKKDVEDYDIVDKIDPDVITVVPELDNVTIYIPIEQEYSQYEIDNFIREKIRHARTSTRLDRNIYEMKVKTKLTEDNLVDLIEFIVDSYEYCAVLDKKD